MARLGIFRMARSDFQRALVYLPSCQQTTLPASSRSRSNQVCQSPPPQVDTQHCSMPFLVALETGLTLRQGLSVWAPTRLKAVLLGSNLLPTVKATRVVLFLVKKYFWPGARLQLSISWSSVKPRVLRCFRAQSTTWQGETPWLTNLRKASPRARLLASRVLSIKQQILSLINPILSPHQQILKVFVILMTHPLQHPDPLALSSLSAPAPARRLAHKQSLIEFYLEEKARRQDLHADQQRGRIKQGERVLQNLLYLVGVEEERENSLQAQLWRLKQPGLSQEVNYGEESEISLRLSTDTCLSLE